MIDIAPGVAIGEGEVGFQASRSGGPGGQNVNKVATRVILFFDVAGSPSLTAEQRARIGERLSTRISKEGVLRVVSQRHRSQSANRQEALERLVELLGWALSEEPPRKPTRPSRQSRQRRLEEKKRHGARKRERSQPMRWEE
jgi:ribosome-associated protein